LARSACSLAGHSNSPNIVIDTAWAPSGRFADAMAPGPRRPGLCARATPKLRVGNGGSNCKNSELMQRYKGVWKDDSGCSPSQSDTLSQRGKCLRLNPQASESVELSGVMASGVRLQPRGSPKRTAAGKIRNRRQIITGNVGSLSHPTRIVWKSLPHLSPAT
jgi:hypothetical protein